MAQDKTRYTVPASKQGKTAKQVVHSRLIKLQSLMKQGKRIQDTSMTRAFIEAIS